MNLATQGGYSLVENADLLILLDYSFFMATDLPIKVGYYPIARVYRLVKFYDLPVSFHYGLT